MTTADVSALSPPGDAATERRQRWLSVLAKAPADRLGALWNALGGAPAFTVLRRPEVGLIMVQGRMSGTGAAFCVGEMTVTRAAVRLESGQLGVGYTGGRDTAKARTIAVIDALGHLADWRDRIEAGVVGPLAREHDARRNVVAGRAAGTKVEFFTVAREAAA